MPITRRAILGASAVAGLAARPLVCAPAPTIRIGVLTDMSTGGRDIAGPNSVACVRQAVQEFTAGRDIKVEVLVGDLQTKADIGAAIARRWFDEQGVDVVVNVLVSSAALAVSNIAREKNKVALICASTTELTGRQCSPNTVHWSHDTWMLAKSTASSIVKDGGDSWFLIAPNYTFGRQLAQDATRFIVEGGGKVLGSATFPFPETTDFSAYLQQAGASGAKVLGLCTGAVDTVNSVKQAHEFKLNQTMLIAPMLMTVVDVHALGSGTAQGLRFTESFYWDLNDRTRAFTDRLRPKIGRVPTMFQAGDYAASLHYLKAVADMGVPAAKADGRAVVARMKALPTDDDCFGKGYVRGDGRKIHPSYLFQVKSPDESKEEWDLYKLIATTPAGDAFRPLSEGGCPFVHT
ncbi:MAG: ABC transporter substrate-binding protein [Acetobacteraceae bacterium]|nr:ABC transporter substrate-binding protein [Acetobacteraceae bacterium]